MGWLCKDTSVLHFDVVVLVLHKSVHRPLLEVLLLTILLWVHSKFEGVLLF